MSRTLPTTRVRPVATSTDNPVRQLPSSPRCYSNFAVKRSEFTFLYHPSAASEFANPVRHTVLMSWWFAVMLWFDILAVIFTAHLQSLSQGEVSCRSVRSRFDPQTSSWFNHPVEDCRRTVSRLVRHHSALYTVSNPDVWFLQFSTVPACSLQSTLVQGGLPVFMTCVVDLVELRNAELRYSRIPEFNNVELHRPTVRLN